MCTTVDGSIRYSTTRAGILRQGEKTAVVPAQAEQAGTAGNAQAQTITVLLYGAGSLSGVRNPKVFAGGANEEQDAQLRQRLLESYATVSNGTNTAYYLSLIHI